MYLLWWAAAADNRCVYIMCSTGSGYSQKEAQLIEKLKCLARVGLHATALARLVCYASAQ